MNWKDVGEVVAKIAPEAGALLGGPIGAGVGAIISAVFGVPGEPDAVAQAIKTDPEAAVKLQQILSDERVKIQGLLMDYQTAQLVAATTAIEAVNKTMQSEASSEHWPTYSWRPFVGFVFGIMMLGVYFVLPLMKIPVPTVPTEAWMAMGAILGVASWFRGKAQADPEIQTNNKG